MFEKLGEKVSNVLGGGEKSTPEKAVSSFSHEALQSHLSVINQNNAVMLDVAISGNSPALLSLAANQQATADQALAMVGVMKEGAGPDELPYYQKIEATLNGVSEFSKQTFESPETAVNHVLGSYATHMEGVTTAMNENMTLHQKQEMKQGRGEPSSFIEKVAMEVHKNVQKVGELSARVGNEVNDQINNKFGPKKKEESPGVESPGGGSAGSETLSGEAHTGQQQQWQSATPTAKKQEQQWQSATPTAKKQEQQTTPGAGGTPSSEGKKVSISAEDLASVKQSLGTLAKQSFKEVSRPKPQQSVSAKRGIG